MSGLLLMSTGAFAATRRAEARRRRRPTMPAELDVKINGSPMCADNQTASRVRLAIRPKADVDKSTITVTGGPNVLTNVTGEKNAWIAHLKGPRAYAAHTVTVTAVVSGVQRSVPVALPTYVCGPPIPLDARLDGSPECVANDTGTLVRLTLQPKAQIDPASIQVTGAPARGEQHHARHRRVDRGAQRPAGVLRPLGDGHRDGGGSAPDRGRRHPRGDVRAPRGRPHRRPRVLGRRNRDPRAARGATAGVRRPRVDHGHRSARRSPA